MAPALRAKGREAGAPGPLGVSRFPGLLGRSGVSELSGGPATPGPRHGSAAGARAGLAALRARVRQIEEGPGGLPGRARPVLPLGLAALDAALPGGGLPLGALHEIEGERAEWDDGVTLGFCLALLARHQARFPGAGDILWVSRWGDLYPPALAARGLDPGRLVLVRAQAEADLFWAMEEGLRCRRLAAVVGEVEGLDRLAGRRLQLAAEESLKNGAGGVTAFALHRRFRPRRRGREASAALSRWRVTAAASHDENDTAFIGRPRWRLDLLRCRGAAPGSWQVEWNDAACGFSLAPALCDRPLAKGPPAKTQPAVGREPRKAESRTAGLLAFRQAG